MKIISKTFMIYEEGSSFEEENWYFFVEADTKAKAWEKVKFKHLINQGFVLDFICSKTVNEGVSESMFCDSKGWFYNNWVGGYRDDIKERFNNDNQLITEYIHNTAKENIKNYFNGNEEYINLYIKHIFNHDEEVEFSKEMLGYMIDKEYKKQFTIKPIEIIK